MFLKIILFLFLFGEGGRVRFFQTQCGSVAVLNSFFSRILNRNVLLSQAVSDFLYLCRKVGHRVRFDRLGVLYIPL